MVQEKGTRDELSDGWLWRKADGRAVAVGAAMGRLQAGTSANGAGRAGRGGKGEVVRRHVRDVRSCVSDPKLIKCPMLPGYIAPESWQIMVPGPTKYERSYQ